MLVCRIEMWPGGDQSKAYDMGSVLIANAGGTETEGEYSVQLTGKPEHFKRRGFWRQGVVKAFPRKRLGAYDLLLRALGAVIGERNIQAHAAFRKTLERVEREGPPAPADVAKRRGGYPCRQCKAFTMHRHLHDTAHGVPGTHMAGTERFRCSECGCATYATDAGSQQFPFIHDQLMSPGDLR
jgi:hypothetical protein